MPSSHSHRRQRDSQQRLVDDLVRKYCKRQEPSPVLRDIFERPEQSSLLEKALRRQVSLIKCRSQALEDGQVTIYDRALLVLSKYGDDPADLGALEFYLTEYLGVVPIGAVSEGKDVVAKHIEMQDTLPKGHRSDRSDSVARKHASSEKHHKSNSRRRERTPPRDHERRERAKSTPSTTGDEAQLHDRVERILDIYYQAKDEYYSKKQTEGKVNLSSVRFLRDTAENALNYIRAHGLRDHKSIPELESVFKSARDKATQLSGGRKRRFDPEQDTNNRRVKRSRPYIDSYRP